MDKNYKMLSVGNLESFKDKLFLAKELELTSCEMSLGFLPAGKSIPFVHAHKTNEEVYFFIRGKGLFFVDGDEFLVAEGSVVRVSPSGKRCIKADEDMLFVCVQANENSLKQATKDDGIILETKTSWM